MELADFFEISVDVLLGYQMQSKSKALFQEQLKHYIHNRSEDVPFDEIERNLKKFPNDFTMLYRCAELYEVRGLVLSDPQFLRRALELYRRSCDLFAQNTDPDISLLSIQRNIAQVYTSLGEKEKAVKLLKENNPCGMHNARLGKLLADMAEPEEAVKYLSYGLLDAVNTLLLLASGYMTVYMNAEKYWDVIEVVRWVEASLDAVRLPGQRNPNDKILSAFVALAGFAYLQLGDSTSAKRELSRAGEIARSFDAAPTYASGRIRFVSVENATAYDDYGATALEGLEQLVKEQTSPAFSVLWKEVKHEKPNETTAETLHR